MRFISKPREITADQFVSGQPLPEGVSFHQACEGDAGCALDGQYFVVTIHGQQTIVVDGDWIVPEPDGIHFYPVKPDVMERNYQLITDDPEAAEGLTLAAEALRAFLMELKEHCQAAADHAVCLGQRDKEMTWARHAESIGALLDVPYSLFIPKERCPNCGWDGESAEWSGAGGELGVPTEERENNG